MKGDKSNSNMTMKQESDARASDANVPGVRPMGDSGSRRTRKKPELPDGIKVSAGQFVAIKRREYGWSQEELSDRSGVSKTQIGRIERDENIPSMTSIEGLEEALDIDLYDLFLAQKREQSKIRGEEADVRRTRDAIGGFRKELEQKGITGKDLEEVLSGALKSAEDLLKRKKSV